MSAEASNTGKSRKPPLAFSFNDDEAPTSYAAVLEPLTSQCIPTALSMSGGVSDKTVLDVAAGTGALSAAVAEAGGHVQATDSSAAMVDSITQRLRCYPSSSAAVMDGQCLDFADDAFDVAFSLFGVVLFPQWRDGLSELARVTRDGGRCCISTWREPLSVGLNPIIMQAWRDTSAEPTSAPLPQGALTMATPEGMTAEMTAAGFVDIDIDIVDVVLDSSIDDLTARTMQALLIAPSPIKRHFGQMTPQSMRAALIRAAEPFRTGEQLRVTSQALIAAGTRRDTQRC